MAALALRVVFIMTVLIGNTSGDIDNMLYDLDPDTTTTGSHIADISETDHLNSDIDIETKADQCKLEADDNSTRFFTNVILLNRYNLIHFRLIFKNMSVGESRSVIGKDHWVWTYKGHGGGYPYLYLPNDYGYLSFGILLTHSYPSEYHLYFIRKSGNCSGLQVGTRRTDKVIGNAFGALTSKIASQDDRYNSSYWCYTRRLWLRSDFLYWACKNSICTFQTFEYRCCQYYIHFLSKKRKVACTPHRFLFGKIWWMLPIIMGETCFAFYPLLLAKIGLAMQRRMRSIQRSNGRFLIYDRSKNDAESTDDETAVRSADLANGSYVKLKYGSPISFMSTLISPLLHINLNGPIIKRVLRSAIIFLPMSLSAFRVYLDYKFSHHLVKEAVLKGALVGFSSMLAGYEQSKLNFLRVFGGPYIAFIIYIIFGCITLFIPSDLERTLQSGLFLTTGQSRFLLTMSIGIRERMSRVYFHNARGYKKIYHYLKATFCMLFNGKFWKYVLYLFYSRWRFLFYQFLLKRLESRVLVLGLIVLTFPIYLVFSLIELIFSVLYFAFPVISSFFLLYKAFALRYFDNFSQSFKVCKLFQIIVFLPLSVCFCISWYMYCIIFFDGFWFLSKIIMFTYSGIIAYPKLSYGYLILTFMAVYYLVESANNFGQSYQDLLKLTIEAIRRVQRRRNEGEEQRLTFERRGVPLALFSYIVERHLPIRNQLMTTLFKFLFIVSILCISIDLLKTFDMFEDLSLVSHVFTVLFICTLPKIIRVTFLEKHEYRSRKKLLRKLEKTVERALCTDTSSDSDGQEEPYLHTEGYQRLRHQ